MAKQANKARGPAKRKPQRTSKPRSSAAHARATKRRSASHVTADRRKKGRRWSRQVTEHSNALDLQGGVFTLKDPKQIAASLKRSAEKSRRRKADPYRSALSMLTFYINRAGKNLPASRKSTLQKAKDELRRQFGRE